MEIALIVYVRSSTPEPIARHVRIDQLESAKFQIIFIFILKYQTRTRVRCCHVKMEALAQTQTLVRHTHVLVHKVTLEITVKHVKCFSKNLILYSF